MRHTSANAYREEDTAAADSNRKLIGAEKGSKEGRKADIMDSIKKKMRSLAQATEEAESVANSFDTETKATNEIADKFEEQVGGWLIRMK